MTERFLGTCLRLLILGIRARRQPFAHPKGERNATADFTLAVASGDTTSFAGPIVLLPLGLQRLRPR